MSLASKTVLCQMRFTRAGAPFCSVGLKFGIEDVTNRGRPFFGVSNTETPPTYPFSTYIIRAGRPFNISEFGRDMSYGGVAAGKPFYIYQTTHNYPTQLRNTPRAGRPFKNLAANANIEGYKDYVLRGAPYYGVFIGGAAPVSFNATRMFMLF